MADDTLFYKELLDNLSDGVYFVDAQRRITYWNKGAERITGYSSDMVVNHLCSENILTHMNVEGCLLCGGECPLYKTMEAGSYHEEEVFLHHKDGHRVPVWVKVSPIKDREGRIVGAVEVFSDNSSKVAAIKKMEELQALALLDPLTGLGNRRYCDMALLDRITELERYGWPFGLLFMDLDNFKTINDTFGHETGDEVLRVVSKTLLTSTRSNDFIGRWGGEEFLVLLSNLTRERLLELANRFRGLVSRSSFQRGGITIQVTVSIGATLAQPGESPQALMKRADDLMYRSKSLGRNRVTMDRAPREPSESVG